MGHFPALGEVPALVVEHVRRDLELPDTTAAVYAAPRTAERHRDLIRPRVGVVLDPAGARTAAAEAIREVAHVRNHPPDLINVALERLVEGCFEPPAFSTLDEMASRIRGEVNGEIFAAITGRAGPRGVAVLDGLLDPVGPGGKTDLDRVKRSALRARTTAATNKAESYNHFVSWCRSGNRGRLCHRRGRPRTGRLQREPRRRADRCGAGR